MAEFSSFRSFSASSDAAPSLGRRRLLLTMTASALLLPGTVRAAEEKKGLLARTVRLTPMTLPGRTAFGLVRIEADLLVRETRRLQEDVATVTVMRPRIIGRLTQILAEEKPVARGATAAQVERLKARMTDISNEAIGKPLVEDVLIVSLLVN